MRFSVYSEMQSWPDRSPERLDAELAEQIVDADPLGYSSYAIVEPFFFPQVIPVPSPGPSRRGRSARRSADARQPRVKGER